ncbi:MAG: hypothetical protein H6843_11825 [Rhodospirillaceae bacterium]|nr:hypothetical protein [Rhodospirillaceae bacterium]
MPGLTQHDADVNRAHTRAMEAFARMTRKMPATLEGTAENARAAPVPPIGIIILELMKHGGVYSLGDADMMRGRMMAMIQYVDAAGMSEEQCHSIIDHCVAAAQQVKTRFFYNLVPQPYRLHSPLVSYLIYPNRHLRSPINPPLSAESAKPYDGPGLMYSHVNTVSAVPAVFTFLGQFIDHDLTANAANLLGPQVVKGETPPDNLQDVIVINDASPSIDLDSVYGPRVDDTNPEKIRFIPMKDGYFCLDPVPDSSGFDVCRDADNKALIGDKRNDENQIILQIHILAKRLHNHFRHEAGDFAAGKKKTILKWQQMVATDYLPAVCRRDVVAEVWHRLKTDPGTLLIQKVPDAAGTLRFQMSHEFGIGFRFGHAQLRSEYQVNPAHGFRLFDSLSDGSKDLQGGKHLDATRLVDWPFFMATPSNLIGTQVNEVAFDLPESAIPDDINLVNSLPRRNLARSNDVFLCAGEDLARAYATKYPQFLTGPRTPDEIEPDPAYHRLFELDTEHGGGFRTPLWYYLLREAELERQGAYPAPQTLGAVGSLLVAETILSAIFHADTSIFKEAGLAPDVFPDEPLATFLELADLAANSPTPPTCDQAEVPPET